MSRAKGGYRPPTFGAKRKLLIKQLAAFKRYNRERERRQAETQPAEDDEPCE